MTALTNDAALVAAWNRYRVARATLSVLPLEGPQAPGRNDTVPVCEQYDIIEPAEKEIGAAVATTLRGMEIKLWFALAQNIDQSEVDILCAIREDYRHFEGDGHGLDWPDRQVFSAIQSLRALRTPKREGAWDRLRQAYEATEKNLPESASDAELDQYLADWAAAMLGEADDLSAISWKIAQFAKEAEDGGYREDLHEAYLGAILADVTRFAAKSAGQ